MANIGRHWVLVSVICGMAMLLVSASGSRCPDNSTPFSPIADLGEKSFEGFAGGLYPEGNTIPSPHFTTGMQNASAIIPRDTAGRPDQHGAIGMLILGYSTAAMTGRTFREMYQLMHPESPLKIIIGAQGGRDINSMTDIRSDYWDSVDVSIRAAGLTTRQIQVIWISTGDILSHTLPFPDQAEVQTEKYRTVLQHIRIRYPDAQIVFLSDRPYAGYIGIGEPPGPKELAEPSAYYHGWSVKWVIERQITGQAGYGQDSMPFIDWGPALWTNGTKGDAVGYDWDCRDAGKGGIHPSSKGRMKEAARAYHYFAAHPYAAQWFK